MKRRTCNGAQLVIRQISEQKVVWSLIERIPKTFWFKVTYKCVVSSGKLINELFVSDRFVQLAKKIDFSSTDGLKRSTCEFWSNGWHTQPAGQDPFWEEMISSEPDCDGSSGFGTWRECVGINWVRKIDWKQKNETLIESLKVMIGFDMLWFLFVFRQSLIKHLIDWRSDLIAGIFGRFGSVDQNILLIGMWLCKLVTCVGKWFNQQISFWFGSSFNES